MDVAISAPEQVGTGEELEVEVFLGARAHERLGTIHVELVPNIGGESVGRAPVAQVDEPLGQVTDGRSSRRYTFELPQYMEPGEHLLRVRLEVPGWFDARATRPIVVVGTAPPPRVGIAVPFTSAGEGPLAHEAFVEGVLESDVVRPGGELRGRLALANSRARKYLELRASLIVGGRVLASDAVSLRGLGDGDPMGFSLHIPADTEPANAFVKLFVDSRGTVDDLRLRIPVAIVSAVAAPERTATAFGADRRRSAWRAVAQRTGLDLVADELVGHEGGVSIRVGYLVQAGAGRLEAALTWPDLGLGLVTRPERAVVGRDREQTDVFLGALVHAGAPPSMLPRDDRGLVVRRAGGSRDEEALTAIVADALAFARALPAARAAIPVPTAFAAAEASWRALADALHAPLETATMRIAGRLEALPARVFTEWSAGAAARTVVELAPRAMLGRAPVLTPEAEGLRERLASEGTLTIEAEALRLVLPAPWLDGESLLQRLRLMRQLYDLLRSGAGPYR
jgi:hypothetical protein